MKNIIKIFAAVPIILCGCQKAEVDEPAIKGNTLVAHIANGTTRTSMGEMENGGHKVLWSEGDQIAVYAGEIGSEVKKRTYTLAQGANTNKGVFIGRNDGECLYAFYPDHLVKHSSNSYITIDNEFLIRQNYADNSFGQASFPMFAKSENGVLVFHNLFAVLKVSMTGSHKVESIAFRPAASHTSNLTPTIPDQFVIDLDPNHLGELYFTDAHSDKEYVLDCGDGVMLNESEPTSFYIVVPAIDYPGFTLAITTPEGVVEKVTRHTIEFTKSEVRAIAPFRLTLEGDPDYEEDLVAAKQDTFVTPCTGGALDVAVDSNVPYTIDISTDWVKLAGTRAMESKTLCFNVKPNTTPTYRSATVNIQYGANTEKIYIKQGAYEDANITASATELTIQPTEEPVELSISTNRDAIEITKYAEWLSISEIESSTELLDGKYLTVKRLKICATSNNTRKQRIGYITASVDNIQKTITITQPPVTYGDLNINIPNAGTLSDIIEGEEIVLHSKVIITGQMNNDDIVYFMKYDDNVEILDLSGVTFENNAIGAVIEPSEPGLSSDKLYEAGHFEKMDKLREVYLPPTLTKISGNVFRSCPLLEKVDWGENPQLTTIGTGIFQDQFYYQWRYGGPFAECASLKTIDIPAKVVNLEAGAFYGSGLTQINFAPDAQIEILKPTSLSAGSPLGGVKSSQPQVKFGLFSGCVYLQEITIPESVIMIEAYTFKNWIGLKRIVIPETVKYIDATGLFSGCQNLKSVTLPASVTSIPDKIFNNCFSLTDYNFKGGYTKIGYMSFAGCKSLTSFDLSNVTSVGENAFMNCSCIKSIDLSHCETIGAEAFRGTGVESVNIPDNMTIVPKYLFADCANLKDINLNKVQEINSSFCNCDALESVTIPATVQTINDGFSGCNNLKSVILSGGMVCFSNTCFSNTPLNQIVIGKDVVSVSTDSYGLGLPSENNFNVIYEDGAQLETIGLWANMNIKSISIPASVTKLAPYAFYQAGGVTNVDELIKNIKGIGDCAFYNSDIHSITIPEGCIEIGRMAFSECDNLMTFTLPSTLKFIGSEVFSNCDRLVSNTLNGSELVLEGGLFNGSKWIDKIIIGKNIKSLDGGTLLSSNITSIEFEKGSSCTMITGGIFAKPYSGAISVETIDLPAGLVTLGDKVFQSNSTLKSVTIPETVTSIGKYCFMYCSGLTQIVIPENVNSIDDNAFRNCKALSSIYIKAKTPPTIGSSVFDISSDKIFYVPINSVETYKTSPDWKNFADNIVGYDFGNN